MAKNALLFSAFPSKPAAPGTKAFTGGLALTNLVRHNFSLTTLLLIGAAVQSVLILLPLRTVYTVLPVFTFLAWQLVDTVLVCYGFRENERMKDVIVGKHSALPSAGVVEGEPAREEICVVLLTARSNHPLGNFSEGLQKSGTHIARMNADLEARAADYGWLGSTTWMNTSDRTCASELLLVHYFRNTSGLHAFAHGEAHRAGWDWYNSWSRDVGHKYLQFTHEVYMVPAGNWENIYLNSAPSGLGTTVFPVKGQEGGAVKWQSPIVDASRGKMRTSAGRMGLSDGAENVRYGEEPYSPVEVR